MKDCIDLGWAARILGQVILSIAVVLVALSGMPTTLAQTSPAQEAQARSALANRGVDEGELRRRLLERGIDVDAMSPAELAANQATIQSVIDELTSESAQGGNGAVATAPPEGNGTIQEAGSSDAETAAEAEAATRAAAADAIAAEAASEETASEIVSDRDDETQIYGHALFENRTLEVFRADDRIRAPNTYVLDEGDEIAVSIFGVSQADLLLEVGADGFIRPPSQPRIYLRGRTLAEARDIVRQRMSEYYVFQSGQFALSLNVSRTITVSIFGDARVPGTYTLSALNTVLNALVAAGGIRSRGSVRAIQLQRDGQLFKTIDVYDFLSDVTSAKGLDLRNNDVIFVPQRKELVRATGGFTQPMFYELLERETLGTLVEYAGGFTTRVAEDAIKVRRYVAGRLTVETLDFATSGGYELEDGDIVVAPVISDPIEEFVTVQGPVLLPGEYGFRQNMQVGALVAQAQLRPEARRDLAFIERTNPDGSTRLLRIDLREGSENAGVELRRGDVVRVLAANRFVDQSEVTVTGAVRDGTRAFRFPQDGALTLEEALLLAGGLTQEARPDAIIRRRTSANDGTVEYLRVPLSDAATTVLQPYDAVTIYTEARFTDALTVQVQGAVRQPGAYQFDPNLTVEQLIYLSGGLKFEAEPSNVDVVRLDVERGARAEVVVRQIEIAEDGTVESSFELQPFDRIIVRTVAEYELPETVEIVGEVRTPGIYAKSIQIQRVSDLVRIAGGLTAGAFPTGATLTRKGGTGDAVLTLDRILRNPGGPQDLTLLDGDVVSIPKPQELVHIALGSTVGRSFKADSLGGAGVLHVAYQGPRSAKWYVQQFAGGFDDEIAKKKETVVVYADGQIRETSSFLGIRNYPVVAPGATVHIGQKTPKAPKPERAPTSWGELAQAALASVTALITLYLLVDRANDN